ncbi:ATP-dependent DNA helicase MER3 [Blomia tropicalis]|nr:ATP-dependent DNA helicase MER3 [Blomia tropicalis]
MDSNQSIMIPSQPMDLIPVTILPKIYQQVYSSSFQKFNRVQSSLFDMIINDNRSLVISSPTGSGKTVLLELAIIRELMNLDPTESNNIQNYKQLHVLYLAPLKVIVQEKCNEWKEKFAPYGISCFSMTGDTEFVEYNSAQSRMYNNINIMLATPEKFDHIIRTDQRSRLLLNILQLVLIDEVHILSDRNRGDVLEATITRLKSLRYQQNSRPVRFIAISATCPNVNDIAYWLDGENGSGVIIPEHFRPVKLQKLVFGFDSSKSSGKSEYCFDMQLSYRLENVVRTHSNQKPTLIFCATRKSVEFTAKSLSSSLLSYFESNQQRVALFYELSELCQQNFDIEQGTVDNEAYFKNKDLKISLSSGVAFYHSGLEISDRRLLERLFIKSLIPVMVSTSSLAMGVNLPAHLVIIKNTVAYIAGATVEYDISEICQMMGRAGRPQFDTTAKAIIMTRTSKKAKYDGLIQSQVPIESSLHRTLSEQLTIEIVLRTVPNLNAAMRWIKSTFLYRRVVINPEHYGSNVPPGDFEAAYPYIAKWCMMTLKQLQTLGLIIIKEDDTFEPTYLARIVTRQSISISTTQDILSIIGESLSMEQLLKKISQCKEVWNDVILRTSEKRFLNEMNKKIRYKVNDRIRDNSNKINCLIQATLEMLNMESCLIQDCTNIFRSAQRITKCLIEICLHIFIYDETIVKRYQMHYETILAAVLLMKSIRVKLWHDSQFLSRQFTGIGTKFSHILAENGFDTFDKLMNAHPREIEFCLKRNPPFGSSFKDEVNSLPTYRIELRKSFDIDESFELNESIVQTVEIHMLLSANINTNKGSDNRKTKILSTHSHHLILLIGCVQCDRLIWMERISDSKLQAGFMVNKRIIIGRTRIYQVINIDENDDDDDTNKDTQDNSKRKGKEPKTSKKNSKSQSIKTKPKREDSVEFIKLCEQMERNVSLMDKPVNYHIIYNNQCEHTIQIKLISESFVGIDAEAEIRVIMDISDFMLPSTTMKNTNNNNNSNKSKKKQPNKTYHVQNNNEHSNSFTTSVSETNSIFDDNDDEDLVQFLENYEFKDIKGQEFVRDTVDLNDTLDDIEFDFEPSQIHYSQFEDADYVSTSQPSCSFWRDEPKPLPKLKLENVKPKIDQKLIDELTATIDFVKPDKSQIKSTNIESNNNVQKPMHDELDEPLISESSQLYKLMNATNRIKLPSFEERQQYQKSLLATYSSADSQKTQQSLKWSQHTNFTRPVQASYSGMNTNPKRPKLMTNYTKDDEEDTQCQFISKYFANKKKKK